MNGRSGVSRVLGLALSVMLLAQLLGVAPVETAAADSSLSPAAAVPVVDDGPDGLASAVSGVGAGWAGPAAGLSDERWKWLLV